MLRFECEECGKDIPVPDSKIRNLLSKPQGHVEVITCKCKNTMEITNGERETAEFKTRWFAHKRKIKR